MNSRKLVWIGMFTGSFIGSYIPSLWGSGLFSLSSVFFSGVGAIVGIWIGFRMSG